MLVFPYLFRLILQFLKANDMKRSYIMSNLLHLGSHSEYQYVQKSELSDTLWVGKEIIEIAQGRTQNVNANLAWP